MLHGQTRRRAHGPSRRVGARCRGPRGCDNGPRGKAPCRSAVARRTLGTERAQVVRVDVELRSWRNGPGAGEQLSSRRSSMWLDGPFPPVGRSARMIGHVACDAAGSREAHHAYRQTTRHRRSRRCGYVAGLASRCRGGVDGRVRAALIPPDCDSRGPRILSLITVARTAAASSINESLRLP